MTIRRSFTVAIRDAEQRRLDRYLDRVLEMSGDPDVVHALHVQIDERLTQLGPDIESDQLDRVLAELDPIDQFAVDSRPKPTYVDGGTGVAGAAWVVLIGALPLATVLGNAFGEEAGGGSLVALLTAGVGLGAAARHTRLGRFALGFGIFYIAMLVLIVAFDL